MAKPQMLLTGMFFGDHSVSMFVVKPEYNIIASIWVSYFRAVAQKKSPAIGNTAATNAGGKAGSKKGGNVKDPKQGNIMSFFKKV